MHERESRQRIRKARATARTATRTFHVVEIETQVKANSGMIAVGNVYAIRPVFTRLALRFDMTTAVHTLWTNKYHNRTVRVKCTGGGAGGTHPRSVFFLGG